MRLDPLLTPSTRRAEGFSNGTGSIATTSTLAALEPSAWKQTGEWTPTCSQRVLCGLCHVFTSLQRSG